MVIGRMRRRQRSPIVILTTGTLVLLASAVGVALLGPITDLIALRNVSDVAGTQRSAHLQSARQTARTRLLTLEAGLFAGGALWFTARNYVLARRRRHRRPHIRALTTVCAWPTSTSCRCRCRGAPGNGRLMLASANGRHHLRAQHPSGHLGGAAASPTGTGKTVTGATLCGRYSA